MRLPESLHISGAEAVYQPPVDISRKFSCRLGVAPVRLRATPYAPASPRVQGDILSHATVSSRLCGGSTWRIKHTRAYLSRATTALEAGATSWASSWLWLGWP